MHNYLLRRNADKQKRTSKTYLSYAFLQTLLVISIFLHRVGVIFAKCYFCSLSSADPCATYFNDEKECKLLLATFRGILQQDAYHFPRPSDNCRLRFKAWKRPLLFLGLKGVHWKLKELCTRLEFCYESLSHTHTNSNNNNNKNTNPMDAQLRHTTVSTSCRRLLQCIQK